MALSKDDRYTDHCRLESLDLITIEPPQPLVTWIMPVKNGMPFLRDALASIAAQRFTSHRIIVWDNGSTDGSREEIARWVPDRIAGQAVLDRPLGLGAARAALVELAATPFCACLDADDLAAPLRLERQISYLRARPELVALGATPTIVDEHGRALPDWYYPLDDASVRWRSRWQCSLNASSVTFRRDAVLAAGNYHPLNRSQDLDLWMRLSAQGRLENLDERLSSYRRHASNITAGDSDYFALEAEIAQKNAATLFPGLAPSNAMHLWRAAYPRDRNPDSRASDGSVLERAAKALATSFGEREDYFTSTSYYRMQQRYLRSHAFVRKLGPLGPAFHRIRGR